VALIESGAFGGTCINRGCVPSKILIQTAQVASQVRRAPEFGIEAKLTGVDWPAIRDRTFSRTDGISAAGRRGRAGSDAVTLIEGRARFTGPHELTVDDGSRVTADRIVLATGARPVIPPPIAESGVSYHTSDTVMRLDELPASMIIVGGGYVAAELAHLFSSLGVSIRIVSQAGSLLDAFDPEVNVGFCKLYADAATGTLLGAHIMGDQASLLIQPLIQAAASGQRVADIARGQYWIHPALSEVVENALLKLPLDSVPGAAR
jgi:mycothione reductase